MGRLDSRIPVLTLTSCLCPVLPYCQLPTKILFGIYFFVCIGPRTFSLPEVFTGAAEQIRTGRSCLTVLV